LGFWGFGVLGRNKGWSGGYGVDDGFDPAKGIERIEAGWRRSEQVRVEEEMRGGRPDAARKRRDERRRKDNEERQDKKAAKVASAAREAAEEERKRAEWEAKKVEIRRGLLRAEAKVEREKSKAEWKRREASRESRPQWGG